ncbi:MAG TPA: nucleoside monophosphate kinase [Candidatus Saccharimonadales bacterium]|nr:nucleoside monophosphate kinase [Candidatus Saccharimonadales bacterium]
MKILMMGPPACGKGTIGEMLSKELRIPLVSTGQLLRNLTPNSPWYAEMYKAMASGNLAPNEHVAEVLKQELKKDKYASGYILDGWVRQMSDLQFFNPGFDKVVLLEVSEDTTFKRISGRRVCDVDGKNYNIYLMTADELKNCPGRLTQRADDHEDIVKTRLELYRNRTEEAIKYFEREGILLRINAEGPPDEVLQKVLSELGK